MITYTIDLYNYVALDIIDSISNNFIANRIDVMDYFIMHWMLLKQNPPIYD